MAANCAIGFVAGPGPDAANGVFGQDSHGAVLVEEGPAQCRIGLIIAEQSQGQDGGPADLADGVSAEPLQGTRRVPH